MVATKGHFTCIKLVTCHENVGNCTTYNQSLPKISKIYKTRITISSLLHHICVVTFIYNSSYPYLVYFTYLYLSQWAGEVSCSYLNYLCNVVSQSIILFYSWCCTIFDNDFKAVSHRIPAEFQWNPMDSIGNHSWRLLDSDHFHQNSLEKSGNFHGNGNPNGWGSSQMLSIEIPWNSTEFWFSSGNPVESTGTHGGE